MTTQAKSRPPHKRNIALLQLTNQRRAVTVLASVILTTLIYYVGGCCLVGCSRPCLVGRAHSRSQSEFARCSRPCAAVPSTVFSLAIACANFSASSSSSYLV